MKKTFILVVLTTFFLLITGPVMAQEVIRPKNLKTDQVTRAEELKAARMDKAADAQEVRAGKLADRCEQVNGKLDQHLARYEESGGKYQAKHARIQARLDALVARLAAAEIDTTQLEAALVELDALIADFETNSLAYINSLKATRELTCGESEGAFKEQLAASRQLLAGLQEENTAIKEYWQAVLRPIVASLLPSSEQ